MKTARRLRKEMSLPEVLLWQALRTRPAGFGFRRQFPLAPFVLDFACLESRLAIEIDGAAHSCGNRPQRDEARDRYVAQKGFHTMRIPARDVLGDLQGAVDTIVATCGERGPPPPSLRDGPPPRAGEE